MLSSPAPACTGSSDIQLALFPVSRRHWVRVSVVRRYSGRARFVEIEFAYRRGDGSLRPLFQLLINAAGLARLLPALAEAQQILRSTDRSPSEGSDDATHHDSAA